MAIMIEWIRHHGRVAALAGAALMLAGCLDFAAPLDATPQVALDPALLGTWRCLPAKPEADAAPANLVVTRAAREGVYAVDFAADDEDPKPLEAYGSSIDGRTVLNVRGVGPDAGNDAEPWSYARTSFLLPDVLRIELVSDDVLKDVEATSAALRAALESMKDRPGLYVDTMMCVRAKAPDAPPT